MATVTFRTPGNNTYSTLDGAITNVATSIPVASGEGARFPSGDFWATLFGSDTNTNEIVLCSSRATDVLTVTRGQQSTSNVAWADGTNIQVLITAQQLQDLQDALTDGGDDLNIGALVANGDLNVLDAHYLSSQTTEPATDLTSTTLNDGGGSGATITVDAGSTDTAGKMTITAGNGTPTAGFAGSIVFDTPFASAPKGILLMANGANAAVREAYISNVTTSLFRVSFNSAIGSSGVARFHYLVIG